TEIYTLSLHDALPISRQSRPHPDEDVEEDERLEKKPRPAGNVIKEVERRHVWKWRKPSPQKQRRRDRRHDDHIRVFGEKEQRERSEEHTSELQSRFDL